MHAVFVAESPDGQVVGWLHVHERHLVEHDVVAEVNGLVVEEAFRGRGAGQILMDKAEQWAREREIRTVVLRSNVIRVGAHAFYENLGYTTIKSQKMFRKDL